MPHAKPPARAVARIGSAAIIIAIALLALAVVWNERIVSTIFNKGLPITPVFIIIVATMRKLIVLVAITIFIIGILLRKYRIPIARWMTRHRDTLTNIIVLVCTMLALLIIGEITARAMLGKTTFDAGGPAHKDQTAQITYNSYGFRDREFPVERPTGTVRVLALGDSFTFGHGIENDSLPWPKALERMLNENAADGTIYEVINTGQNGYQPKDELTTLERAAPLGPDIVLLGYFYNDAATDDTLRELAEPPSTWSQLKSGTHLLLFSHSYLYGFLVVRWEMTRINLGLKESYPERMNNVYRLHAGELSMHKEQLMAIRSRAETIGAEFVLVIIPANYDFNDYPLMDGEQFMRRFCEESRTACIDLLDTVRDEDYRKTRLNEYDAHPSEYGHTVLARAVMESPEFRAAMVKTSAKRQKI
ncbi:TPA: SGNH/GDSL hydrolase family protein [Candidatus Woesearchaeota archaeon]|nr:SGNH/GDSL hydrolase family protein [Candidatus Woesearchaeota archaeon]